MRGTGSPGARGVWVVRTMPHIHPPPLHWRCRALHAERQDLIQQWDQALEAMRHRDASIMVATEQVRTRA